MKIADDDEALSLRYQDWPRVEPTGSNFKAAISPGFCNNEPVLYVSEPGDSYSSAAVAPHHVGALIRARLVARSIPPSDPTEP